MNGYLKFSTSKSSGFTLLEVLLASSMTLITVMIAGFGVVTMTRVNIKNDLESSLQNTTNRAMEFISGELRRSETIITNPTELSTAMAAISYSLPADAEPILVTKLNSGETIVYFTAQADTSKPWMMGTDENIALYRWGPQPDLGGDYSTEPWGKPVVMMDSLSTDVLPNSSRSDCEGDGGSFLAHQSGSGDLEGFYVCVSSNNRLAAIHAVASSKLAGNKAIEYAVDTHAFARSAQEDEK